MAGNHFPVGTCVLAVDGDQTGLKVLENLLRKCQYHVTTTTQTIEAREMLKKNRNEFELVISDVNMTDMDHFKFFEQVVLEMDLPIISKKTKKQSERKEHHDKENGGKNEEASTWKKPHLVWTAELHKKFVYAVNQLGLNSIIGF
ncbi:Signal transduction response regulator, receiver domain [Sesbania bispinosa]|nr:Signal transduction response regulator, receiver domain [Sesbania bispinosa]